MNEFHELLARAHRLAELDPDRSFAEASNELAGELIADVGLQKNQPDFPESLFDLVLGQDASAREVLQNPRKPLRQGRKHIACKCT